MSETSADVRARMLLQARAFPGVQTRLPPGYIEIFSSIPLTNRADDARRKRPKTRYARPVQ